MMDAGWLDGDLMVRSGENPPPRLYIRQSILDIGDCKFLNSKNLPLVTYTPKHHGTTKLDDVQVFFVFSCSFLFFQDSVVKTTSWSWLMSRF